MFDAEERIRGVHIVHYNSKNQSYYHRPVPIELIRTHWDTSDIITYLDGGTRK